MTKHDKRLDNLKPFARGKSGNPKGRPKKLPQLDTLLAEVLGDEKDGISAASAILMAIRSKAIRGDVRAAEVLLDRAWGKVKSHIDITSADHPITPTSVRIELVGPSSTDA